MKKIIAIVFLFFAFSVAANAQDKKVSSAELAKKDITALITKIKINPTLQADLTTLMISKHDALSNPELSEIEKANVSKHTDRKIMSGLSEEQRNELLKYPDLVKQLSH